MPTPVGNEIVAVIGVTATGSAAGTTEYFTTAQIGGVGSVIANGGTQLRTLSSHFGDIINVKDFGLNVGTGGDDTAAFQAAIVYAQTNYATVNVPAGNYNISATLNFTNTPSWGFVGDGAQCTNITMTTNNIPMFNFGATGSSYMNSCRVSGFLAQYKNSQSSSNTNAQVFLFSALMYESYFEDIIISNAYDGFYVANGIGCPWGTTWDDVRFYGTNSGHAMDWTVGVNAVPNNHFGRLFCDCNSLTDTAFKNIKGYNFTIDIIEFLNATNIGLMSTQAGSSIDIGSMKLEVGTYNSAGVPLFLFTLGNYIRVGSLTVSTITSAPTSGQLTVFQLNGSSSNVSCAEIGHVGVANSQLTNTNVVFDCGQYANVRVGSVVLQTGFNLNNQGANTTCDYLVVKNYANDLFAQDNGDNSLTITLGMQTTQPFNTPFSTSRTITLPAVDNNMCNGLSYTLIFYGAINGSNYAIINNGNATLNTLETDRVAVTYSWHRNPSHAYAGWVMTGYQSLP